MNPRGAPQGIRRGQLPDQRAHIRRDAWAPSAPSAFPGPEQPKAAPVPRHDRLWRDDVDGRPPTAPGVWEPCPKKAVGRRETKTWAPRSTDDGELVSERDDFQVPQGARSDQETKGVKERDDDGRHNRIHRIVAAPSQRRPRLWDSKGGSMRKLIGVLLVALALQIFAGPVRATHDDEREGRSSDERHSGQKALERIDHIVVIYQENWSFDSLFGLFPGADGIANAVNASGDLLFPQVSKRSCSPPLFRWTCVAHSQQPQSTQ